jgi:hypothetical protein
MATARAASGRALALVALAEGDAQRAADHALAAADEAAAAGATLELARAQLLAGRATVTGDRDAGIALLTAAGTQGARCGAPRVADEVRLALRRAGVRVGQGGARAPGSQERARARDCRPRRRGLTNREIGARLFLSEKTIETHLTRVFQKLRLRSRAQVAAEVAGSRRCVRPDPMRSPGRRRRRRWASAARRGSGAGSRAGCAAPPVLSIDRYSGAGVAGASGCAAAHRCVGVRAVRDRGVGHGRVGSRSGRRRVGCGAREHARDRRVPGALLQPEHDGGRQRGADAAGRRGDDGSRGVGRLTFEVAIVKGALGGTGHVGIPSLGALSTAQTPPRRSLLRHSVRGC